MADPWSLIPASGAWRDGDPAGGRRFADVGDVKLESGAVLPGVRIAYETWGSLAPDRSNAVLVLHALTGDSHVVGETGAGHASPGWWPGMVGPGAVIDTDRYYVVAPNVLGGCQGTTGPASVRPGSEVSWGSAFPRITVRDQVTAEAVLADLLGVERWAGVVGGSMGGMRAVEWAVSAPDRVASLALLAACASASAEQIALSRVQIEAIQADPAFKGGDFHRAEPGAGPHVGLGIARRLAHVTYRSEPELRARFGRSPQDGEDPFRGGRYAVESYLDHHAQKLARRFDAASYVVLSEAMNGHDVGRGRGGVPAALRAVTARTVVAGIDSDRLYPRWQQDELAEGIPSADQVRVISSDHGHDGFLLETDQVSAVLAEVLPPA